MKKLIPIFYFYWKLFDFESFTRVAAIISADFIYRSLNNKYMIFYTKIAFAKF